MEYKNEIKNCQNCKNDFTIESDDFSFYEKIKVPPPTWCPECRMQRRMMWRNERTLYFVKCTLCNKRVVSMYDENSVFPIYCNECYVSDKWDARDYSIDYDFSRNFFDNFHSLMKKVPRCTSIYLEPIINSDYSNYFGKCKNVYLSFSVLESEDVYYSRAVEYSRSIYDSSLVTKSDTCYDTMASLNDYNVAFSYRTENCIDSRFLFDCVNCNDCFMSSNLRNKSFVFKNKQLTKEAYLEALSKIDFSISKNVSLLKEEFLLLKKNALHKYTNMISCKDSSGDNLGFSNNTKNTFDSFKCDNVSYSVRCINKVNNCYDIFGTENSELMYESVAGGFGSYNSRFINYQNGVKESDYCDTCKNITNCFGCIGLKNAQFCILNKQYSKEEYFSLVDKIKEDMMKNPYVDQKGRIYKYGEFFPPTVSPFAYNETITQEYFPISREEAQKLGFLWKENRDKGYNITKSFEDISESIFDISEDICDEVFECKHKGECIQQCTKAFRIKKEEYFFYKKMGFALPVMCSNCRYYERLNLRNPLKLYSRNCMCVKENHHNHTTKCEVNFKTPYAPDRPEIVYCEKCYQQEVY